MATKLTARLSLSWTKQRQLRKISKSVGIKIDSEKKGIIVQKDLMCANVCVEQLECHVMMYFFEKATNTDCLKTHLWHPFRIDQPLFRIFRAVPREKKSWHGTAIQSLMIPEEWRRQTLLADMILLCVGRYSERAADTVTGIPCAAGDPAEKKKRDIEIQKLLDVQFID